jgi:hypothetical protein
MSQAPSNPPESAPPGPPHHQVLLAGIRWPSAFEFTYLFRGFRLAMDPNKLIIALLAIVAIYTGGRFFDALWGPRVYKDEIESFQDLRAAEYLQQRDEKKDDQKREFDSRLADAVRDSNLSLTTQETDSLRDNPRSAERVLRHAYIEQFQKATAGETPKERADEAERLKGKMFALEDTVGSGIFDSFMTYEIRQFDSLIENTLTFVRISPMHTGAGGDQNQAISGGLFSNNPDRIWRSDTVLGCIANMTITAPRWLVTGTEPMQWHPAEADAGTWSGWAQTWFFHRIPYLLTLFVLLAFWLVIMAFSGGMLCRLSALEFAGSEELGVGQIMKFVRKKLAAFITAPLLPLMIIVVLGAMLSLGGLVGSVPYIGEILLGIFFCVFLAGAVIMMLVMLGVIGGFNLMYPTIAVEGSDAFDACSRSWAYVYGAPWRLILYTVISLVYGIITLLFVSFAAYLVLSLTHTFVGLGTDLFGITHGHFNGLPKLETLWPSPKLNQLHQPINWWAMNWSEWLGSVFLHFWVFIVITLVGAYAMSLHYSIHTILYFLLRRAVEGQSINDVYREEEAGEAAAPVSAPAAPSA